MPKNNKKKAFTLTELLVVVVIIGVLAAVILPKFNKVVETRKTTEAEEIMAAVRMEQEYRCAMDKPYIGDIAKLSQIPQAATKNFTYQLDTNGMLASSRSKSYNLKMPSYADGRVCCEGSECNKLNKDYPKCDDLTNRPDFKVATECTAELPAPVEISCPGTPQTERSCDTGCGTQTRSYECVNGEYVYGEWAPVCVAKPEDDTDPCPGGYSGTQTRSAVCNTSTGQWDWGNWDTNECKCIPTNEYGYIMIEEDCPEGQTGYIYKEWDYTTCQYEYVGDSCKAKSSFVPYTYMDMKAYTVYLDASYGYKAGTIMCDANYVGLTSGNGSSCPPSGVRRSQPDLSGFPCLIDGDIEPCETYGTPENMCQTQCNSAVDSCSAMCVTKIGNFPKSQSDNLTCTPAQFDCQALDANKPLSSLGALSPREGPAGHYYFLATSDVLNGQDPACGVDVAWKKCMKP